MTLCTSDPSTPLRADRKKDLAAIHIAAGELGMDRATYESMLYTVAGATAERDGKVSAAHLDHVGRSRVLEHLRRLGWQRTAPRAAAGRPTPAPDRLKMVRKIRAMLYYSGRSHEYADKIAKTRFHVERYEWLPPEQMRRLIAMFEYDRARKAVRAQRERAAPSTLDPRPSERGDA